MALTAFTQFLDVKCSFISLQYVPLLCYHVPMHRCICYRESNNDVLFNVLHVVAST